MMVRGMKRCRRRFPIPLWLLFLGVSRIGLAPAVAQATTIVGIRTPAQVVIAADSMGTSRGNRIETTRPVCKIFTVNETAFAIGGLVKDLAWNFDAENLAAGSIRRQNRLTDVANDLAERLTGALGSYLERLKTGNPSLYAKSLEGENGSITSILLAAYEGDRPVAIGMEFRASEGSGGTVGISSTRVTCPGDCPDGVMYFLLGERRPIDRYIAEHGGDRLLPAGSGAPFLVQLVIDGGSKRVGPPIDVMVIGGQGVSWPARKEGCGGAPSPDRRTRASPQGRPPQPAASADLGQALSDRLLRLLHILLDVLDEAGRQLVLQLLDLVLLLLDLLHQPLHVLLERADALGELSLDAPESSSGSFSRWPCPPPSVVRDSHTLPFLRAGMKRARNLSVVVPYLRGNGRPGSPAEGGRPRWG